VKSDPLQLSRRRDIPSRCLTVQASSVRTMRTFRPDLPLCREASNFSSLHPSGCFSSTSGRHSVFNQLWYFFPKHRYGKTAAIVQTMWIPVRTRSSIRQVMHSKSRRPDVSPHGSDARTSYMEIVCIRSTVRTIEPLVQTRQPLIWKLRAAKVRLSGRQDNTVRTRLISGKNFCEIWKADRTVVHPDALCLPSGRCLGISSQTLI
jgi:hypothetical protein